MKATSGMDYIKLLRVAADTGVRELRIGEFSVSFFEKEPSAEGKTAVLGVPEAPPMVFTKEMEDFARKGELLQRKKEFISSLPIENPILYEKMLASGDISLTAEQIHEEDEDE